MADESVSLPPTRFGGLGHNAESLKQHDMTGLSRFSMRGPSLPLQSSWTLTKALASGAFREGLQFGISKGLNLTLSALLVYQMAQPSDNIFAVYSSANTNSILALSSQFRTHPALFSLFAFPPAYGLLKGLLALRPFDKLSPQVLTQAHQTLKERPASVFNDYIRWFLPVYPLNNALTTLEAGLLWEGRTDKSSHKEREQAFAFIQTLAQQRQGLTQTQALLSLSHLAYGFHLKDIHHLKGAQEPQTLLHLLSLKTRAFESLKDTPLDNRLSELYRISYLWSLGYSPSFWKTSVPLAAINTGRLAAKILSFVAIIKTIMAYLDCPEKPGLTFSGYQKWSSDYTQPCFDEFVRLFNTIPGQPAHTLTDGIPQYYFPDGTYSLDLSGKGLEETVILEILQGFMDQHKKAQGPSLTGLNLSNNQFGSQSDNNTLSLAHLLTQFPALNLLDLSNNQIGLNGIQGVQALTQSLSTLQFLKNFTILPSRTLSARMISLFDSTRFRLTNHPDLLPQPNRLTSPDDVRVYFQTANLSTTAFDFSGKVTDDAQGQTLTTLMNSLRDYNSLTLLDLSNNLIGLKSDKGATAVANGLVNLSSIKWLDLSNNWFGFNGNKSVNCLAQTLERGLPILETLKLLPNNSPLSNQIINMLNLALSTHPDISPFPFPLLDSNTIRSFFLGVHPFIRSLDLSNMIFDDANGTIITTLMQFLSIYNQSLTSLDLSGNQIGSLSDLGTIAIGNGLANLKNLTFLDISNNRIGLYGDAGTIAIGNGLANLKNLTFLGLSNSCCIGYTGDAGTIAIGNGLTNLKNLTFLDISHNTPIGLYGDAGTIAIGNSLANLKNLASLNFSYSNIGYTGNDGVIAVGNGLANLKDLIFLDISNNNYLGFNESLRIGALSQAFEELFSLKSIKILPSIGLSSKSIILLNSKLKSNTEVTLIPIPLTDASEVASYFLNTKVITSFFNFSGLIVDDSAGLTLTTLMQFLSLYNETLTSLDLSHNQIGSYSDIGTVAIGNGLGRLKALTYLDLSNNWNIGYTGEAGVIAIGNALESLRLLTYLDLSNTNIGTQGDKGTIAIGNSLQYLSSLRFLNLGRTSIGLRGDDGTLRIGNSLEYLTNLISLDVGYNYIGFLDDKGTIAIGNSFKHLTYLNSFNFRNTFIGYHGYNGTVAIGNGLASLKSLAYLDLSHNWYLGSTSSAGIIAIGNNLDKTALVYFGLSSTQISSKDFLGVDVLVQGLGSLASLKKFDIVPSQNLSPTDIGRLTFAATYHPVMPSTTLLKDPAAVQAYFQTDLPSNSSFSFPSNLTDDASGATLSTLMLYLRNYTSSLTSLDLSHNQIGFYGDAGTQALGQSLAHFKALTHLDLSYNQLGFQSSNGTILIGQALTQLPSLVSLNLGYNQIGSTGPEGSLAIVSAIPSLVNLQDLSLNGITNIHWDDNLVNINAFTSRKLQAICQSQLCHGTAITSVKKASTSSASRLQAPWPFRFMNNAIDNVGRFLFHSWNTLVDKMRKSAKEVTSDSPAYFPNINNPYMSDWQPNPLRNREQSEDYASLAPYVLQQSTRAYVSPPALLD